MDLGTQAPAPQPRTSSATNRANDSSSSSAETQSSASSSRADSSAGKPASSASAGKPSQSDKQSSDGARTTKDTSSAGNVATSKGRQTRPAAKTATAAAQQAEDAATDPNATDGNTSGLSLLQMLAKSLEGQDSATPTTGEATDEAATTDKSNDKASSDPNAQAVSVLTQALAAAFGAGAQTQPGATNSTPGGADGAAQAIGDTTRGTRGSLAQDLAAMLTQSMDAKDKTDAGVQQPPAADNHDSVAPPSADAASLPNAPSHLGVTSHFQAQATQANSAELKSTVGSSGWNDELGGQLTWMATKGIESGSLRVSPEHLGPVEVQISVQNGDASVWFGASHPDTRAAIEQALPRLREMFASQGLTLTDSGVSRESPRNQSRNSPPPAIASLAAVGSADVSVSSTAARLSLGLVDTYA